MSGAEKAVSRHVRTGITAMNVTALQNGEPDRATERLRMAEQILFARRARSQFFDASLFAEPAWDIILDLYVAHCRQVQVSVSSLCIAAGVPETTALRWIKSMAAMGLLHRSADATDHRRTFVTLSADTIAKTEAFLDLRLRPGRRT